ncbi:C40 family peptidase [Alphaproteobacteria bacterium]|nr:C40 family peptidase [Alphaproteobacteria bacterium]
MNIIVPSSAMRAEPIETSELETECLFGENVEVLKQKLDWIYCKLLTDNYYGWIKKKDLGYLKRPTHRVVKKRSFLFKNKNSKSSCFHYIPLGSQLSIQKIEDNWAEVNLSNNNKYNIAYIPSNHIVPLNHKIKDWVSIAELILGTPYKWGGRDSIGLDCSALLQLSYQTYGQNIPRNTISQLKLEKEIIIDIGKLNRGFVIFWKGHVGIMTDKLNCIHANGFHMETIKEPLNEIILRMNKNNPIIKMMNFN